MHAVIKFNPFNPLWCHIHHMIYYSMSRYFDTKYATIYIKLFFLLNPSKDPCEKCACIYIYMCVALYILVNKLLSYPIFSTRNARWIYKHYPGYVATSQKKNASMPVWNCLCVINIKVFGVIKV